MDFVRPKRASVGIDLAPLIDCVFLLLIFFMLSSSFLQPAIPLKLPGSVSQIMPDPSRVTISMDETGQLFLLDEPVTMEQLRARLVSLHAENPDQIILFRGDRVIRYEQFMDVVTLARETGFLQISLQHEAPAANPP